MANRGVMTHVGYVSSAMTELIRKRIPLEQRTAAKIRQAFEEIWDEVLSGNSTYGRPNLIWIRWLRNHDERYWFQRIRGRVLRATLPKKEG